MGLSEALQMLQSNHERLGPEAVLAVLKRLPGSLKVRECKELMQAVFKSYTERKRGWQIQKNLLRQASLQLSVRKLTLEQGYHKVHEDTKCSKCRKRIGQAAFVRYPSGDIFHYVCVRQHANLLQNHLAGSDSSGDSEIDVD